MQRHSRARLVGAALTAAGGVGLALPAVANGAAIAHRHHPASTKIAKNPFAGQTIRLISSGGAGSTHDLFARALGPEMAKYLHATVDVVDMPGAGQLLAWNYTNHATPNGLTISTVDVEGVMANLWEKVPGNSVNPNKITWLGGFAGAGRSEVLFASTSEPAGPRQYLKSVYSLLKDHSVEIKELGSVGDIPGPLFFKLYHIPSTDLTSYAGSLAELQGVERGDGPVTVKSFGGSFADWVKSGGANMLLSFSMLPKWPGHPNVPTLPQLFKHHPPKVGEAAIVADATALDAGTGVMGPPGLSATKAYWLRAAIQWSFKQSAFKKNMDNAQLPTIFESAQQQMHAVKLGIQSKTVALIRKYVPPSTGVAS
jgi:tripartite-type tricarboxylate transporter receptor subunit TctC